SGDFDGSARKSAAGTLGGCQGALTLRYRKSALFPAPFSYGTPAKGPLSERRAALAVHPH
ncbi:MAG TPA: hypothetical protein H9770_04680, partial [Candidatus Fournierella excrementigallinarum]|nr:hypothetical protein [Candidatus Fournierella excrementigallinarum]